MNAVNTIKPNLYQNNQLPFGELSADSFEDFVYQSLVLLADQKKIRMQSGPQPSGDEGFDCTAKQATSDELICIQCKRYNNTLYTATVVEEIVKVALNGILNDSTPRHHYIITSGTVSGTLRQQLRENKYTKLKEECKKLLDKKKSQLTLISKVKKESIDPYSTICNYLDSLKDLIVWSGKDFQNELGVIWSKLTDVLEKHFSLAIVFKEHPRPDFDVSVYLKNKQVKEQNLIPLQYQQSQLPNNLKVEGQLESNSKIVWSIDDVISCLKQDKNILISSLGGSGKSSTLSMIEEQLISSIEDIEYVPIRINLRSYSRNSLKQTIEQKLKINCGSWRSLPFKFVFLFDALDEMLQHDTQAFIDEVESIIHGYSFILTLRSTGVDIETVLPSLDYCISVQPLSYRSVFAMAEKTFKNEELGLFYDEYRQRLSSIGFNFLSLPFVLSMTIEYYKNNKKIPDKIESILEDWIQSKINLDAGKRNDTNITKNQIPKKYIEQVFSLILYKCRIEKNLSSIPQDDFHEIILECYQELESSNSYVTKLLSFNEFISLVSHYEILMLTSDGHYSTPHSIISDYLIAKVFAAHWQEHTGTALVNSLHDIWLYSSNFIKEQNREKFLGTVLSFNLYLGAKVSTRFGEKYIQITEKKLLESEQSEKIIRRGDAIFALGVLGTDICLQRLRSTEGYLDVNHSVQRQRSLAVNGDKDTLLNILQENEMLAQAPMKFSGGTKKVWFNSPPAVITDIARLRIQEWFKNKTIPLCFCLETIGLFGDSQDIGALIEIISETEIKKEFVTACNALNALDNKLVVKLLIELINKAHHFSHQAKKLLLSLGIYSDINYEINYLIQQLEKSEPELIEAELMHGLYELAEFIGEFELSEQQVEQLLNSYEGFEFRYDLYIYNLIWIIASKSKNNSFLPLVKLAFSRKQPEEINHAIRYLSCLDELKLSNELSEAINDYFCGLREGSYGLKLHYAKYYLKHGQKQTSYKIIFEAVEKLLVEIAPESLTHDQYTLSFGSTDRVFNFIETAKDITLHNSLALKFLLIDTNHCEEHDIIKRMILSRIDVTSIENYANKVKDASVKVYVAEYLLKNHFTHNVIEVMKQYLPKFLSHHMFYSTIKTVSEEVWNDEFASLFLSCFQNHKWTQVDSQMFEDYIDFYAQILTKEQLVKFEQKRDKPINSLVNRCYNIWLEHNGL